MKPEKLADKEFGEHIIEKVISYKDGGWEIQFDNSTCFGIPKDSVVTPKKGMLVRIYGAFGHEVRGLDLNNTEIFYRTPVEQEEKHRKRVEESNCKKKKEYEKKKIGYQKRIDVLPEVFQARFERFRKANPDFGWDYEDYELFACEEAVKIAKHCETKDAVVSFQKKPWEEQIKAGISDGHSGNTFGFACRLAYWYVSKPENVTLEHGALVSLVGCKAYGCDHPEGIKT